MSQAGDYESQYTLNDADEPEEEQPEKFSPFRRQLLAASPPIIASISSGMLFGYSATLIPELQQPESEIHITPEVASWIASAVPLLMSIGCLVCGPLMARFGRKNTHLILCVPKFLGWITIFVAPNLTVLLIGRVLGGFSAGLLATLFPAYLGEVSAPKYRGVFLAGPSIALAVGIFGTHFTGSFLNWRNTAITAAIFPVLTALVLLFVPETPSWYISKNMYGDALDAFQWLRGSSGQEELDETWENHKQIEFNRRFNTTVWSRVADAFRHPEFRKPFMIIFCCFFVMQFSGPYIVAFYCVNILEKILGSAMNEYVVMNVIDLLRLVMVIVASGLLRVTRRRVLMVTSGVGTALSAFTLAGLLIFFNYFPSLAEYSWISIVALVSYIVFVSVGVFVLPWCVAGELYPLEYRSVGTSINVSINFFLFFIVIKAGPGLFITFGMEGAFLFYGVICLLGTVILHLVLPETKNRTLVAIEKQFSRQNTQVVINETRT